MGRTAKRAGLKSPEAIEQTPAMKAALVRGVAYLTSEEYQVFKACALRMGRKPDEQIIPVEGGKWTLVRVFNDKLITE